MVLARKLKVGVYKRCQEGLGSGGNPSTWGILETTVYVEAFQLKNFPIFQTELSLNSSWILNKASSSKTKM